MHPQFKYIHLSHLKTTIGYRINEIAGQPVSFSYAIARTSPKDNFNKAIGRKIVEGRLDKGGIKSNGRERALTVSLDAVGGSTRYADISKHIIDQYVTNLIG